MCSKCLKEVHSRIMPCLDRLDVCEQLLWRNHLYSHIHWISSSYWSTDGLSFTWTVPKSVFSTPLRLTLQFHVLLNSQLLPTCHQYVLMLPEMQHEELTLASFPSKNSTLSCLLITSNTIPILLVPRLAERDFLKPHHPFYLPMPLSDQVLLIYIFSHFLSALSLPVYFPAYHFHPRGLRLYFPSSSKPLFQSPSFSPTYPSLFTCFALCPECPLHILCWCTLSVFHIHSRVSSRKPLSPAHTGLSGLPLFPFLPHGNALERGPDCSIWSSRAQPPWYVVVIITSCPLT